MSSGPRKPLENDFQNHLQFLLPTLGHAILPLLQFYVATVLKVMCCELRTFMPQFNQPTSTQIFWSCFTIWAPISFMLSSVKTSCFHVFLLSDNKPVVQNSSTILYILFFQWLSWHILFTNFGDILSMMHTLKSIANECSLFNWIRFSHTMYTHYLYLIIQLSTHLTFWHW